MQRRFACSVAKREGGERPLLMHRNEQAARLGKVQPGMKGTTGELLPKLAEAQVDYATVDVLSKVIQRA